MNWKLCIVSQQKRVLECCCETMNEAPITSQLRQQLD